MWSDADRLRAPPEFPPRWASAWGDDQYGLWAQLGNEPVSQVFRWIEPGRFLMGSTPEEIKSIAEMDFRKRASEREFPRHLVTLSQGYWLAEVPCTHAFWKGVMGENPIQFKEEADAAERPVESVSWDDVQGFLERLNLLLPEGIQACLPTESQWEYAARAGTRSAYWWGDEADGSRANWYGAQRGTTPVRRYAQNPWGLFDVHGNVWEWCAGSPRPYRGQAELDPPDGDGDLLRALRGGSWSNPPGCARAAYRYDLPRAFDSRYHGFRLVLRSVSQGGGAEVLGSRE